jgi:hypothetical protein
MWTKGRTAVLFLGSLYLLGSLLSPAIAQKKKPPVKKPPAQNETKGQNQQAGSEGQFGTIYSLQNELNFCILSAKYTLEPFISYNRYAAETEKKLLVLDLAIKNNTTVEKYFDGDSFISVVDSKGEIYNGADYALVSKNGVEGAVTLRPGQGVGQPALKDPYQVAFLISNKSRIVKIIVNQGRLGKQEKVLRYFVAGATKEEAGEAGDPKNVIAGLPDNCKDPADKTGSTPLAEGKGKQGEYFPTGVYGVRFNSLDYSSDAIKGNPPDEGKKFAIVNVTVKLNYHREFSMFEFTGGDTPLHELVDGDGEHIKPFAFLKAKSDEDAEHSFKRGDEYNCRIVFMVPQKFEGKKLVLGATSAPKWAYDISAIK